MSAISYVMAPESGAHAAVYTALAHRPGTLARPSAPPPFPKMSFTQSLLIIVLLIAASAFFSVAEISLAASRRLRLRQLADDGDVRALVRCDYHDGPALARSLRAALVAAALRGRRSRSRGGARATLRIRLDLPDLNLETQQ